MSLLDKIKETTEEIKTATGDTTPAAENDDAAPAEGADDAPADGDEGGVDGEEAKAPAKDAKAKDSKDKSESTGKTPAATAQPAADKDSAAMARLRAEAAANKRRADEAERRYAESQKPKAPAADPAKAANPDPEPDKDADPEAHIRWELRQAKSQLQGLTEWRQQQETKTQRETMRREAVEDFTNHEDVFKAQAADYEDVSRFFLSQVAAGIRIMNPNIAGPQLNEAVQNHVLRLAGQAQAQGYNPVEALYHMAKGWGYQPKAAPAEGEGAEGGAAPAAAGKDAKQKPDFKSIANSKKKSASSLTAGGKSGHTPLSREAVLSKGFGLSDFARLTPNQLKELEGLAQ